MAWAKSGSIRGPQGDRGPRGDPAPNQVAGAGAGGSQELTLWVGSQSEYDAITSPDDATVYVVKKDKKPKRVSFGGAFLNWAGESDFNIPPHQAGDIIIVQCCDTSGEGLTAMAPPPGGTVPEWTSLKLNEDDEPDCWGAGLGGSAVGYGDTTVYSAVATSDDHTSGTWLNISAISIIVAKGNPKGLGAFAVSTLYGRAGSAGPHQISCPAVTLQNASGSSEIIHSVEFYSEYIGPWAVPDPVGYTVEGAGDNTGSGAFLVANYLWTKDDTTSCEKFVAGTVPSDGIGVSSLTIEILY